MGKIIIHNRSRLTDASAVEAVAGVMYLGKISDGGAMYCRGVASTDYRVFSSVNSKSDKFIVLDNTKNNKG